MNNSDLIKPAEVAAMFKVHVSTVRRWADEGYLSLVKTPGGQCRYHRKEAEELAKVSGK